MPPISVSGSQGSPKRGGGSTQGSDKPVVTRRSSLAPGRDRGTVAVVIFRDAPLFETSIPLTVFGVDRRGAGLPYYRTLVCAGEAGSLTSTASLRLAPPFGLAGVDSAGTVIVPAWRSPGDRPPEAALTSLRRAYREGARIVGISGGVFVLAAAGLLDDRTVTTHWMYAPALARHYPRARVNAQELFIDDETVLTGGGGAAGIDLCLHIVRTDHGNDAANTLARHLVFPPTRRGGQSPYIDDSVPETVLDDPLAEILGWALAHLPDPFDINALAARASLSRRNFDRRFRAVTGSAPLQWLNAQRVRYAQRMLEATDLPIDEIARRSGFGSTVAMRGHFRRLLATSPAAYRETYRGLMGQEARKVGT
jgi:transcriptional regulator GlxA family with amidase domain